MQMDSIRRECVTPQRQEIIGQQMEFAADLWCSSPIILFSFLIGLNLSFTVGSVIDAGVSTIFVGLGEDPM